jgi:hypothetical protein
LSDNGMINAYGAIGAMRIGMGNQSTWKKPAPLQLCSPQIPHDLTEDPGHHGGKPAATCLSYGVVVHMLQMLLLAIS